MPPTILERTEQLVGSTKPEDLRAFMADTGKRLTEAENADRPDAVNHLKKQQRLVMEANLQVQNRH